MNLPICPSRFLPPKISCAPRFAVLGHLHFLLASKAMVQGQRFDHIINEPCYVCDYSTDKSFPSRILYQHQHRNLFLIGSVVHHLALDEYVNANGVDQVSRVAALAGGTVIIQILTDGRVVVEQKQSKKKGEVVVVV